MIRAINALIVLTLIWFLNNSFQDRQLSNISATEILGTEVAPDYYSENLQIRQFDEQGRLQSFVKTQRLAHYADKYYASLDEPELILYDQHAGKKSITANAGQLSDDNYNLTLTDNVLLLVSDSSSDSSSDSNNHPSLEIKTEELSYQTEEKTISSSAGIEGISNANSFSAESLSMNVDSEQLVLKDKVKIHYQKYQLDVTADALTSNPNTELSRLSGNIILKHLNRVIKSEQAEVHSSNDEKTFILTGNLVSFRQSNELSSMTAKTRQLVYRPKTEKMQLDGEISVIQSSKNMQFEVKSESLEMLFREQQAFSFSAEGTPAIFVHQLDKRVVKIEAEHIDWTADSNLAVLTMAKVFDAQTTFSADEIIYNTLTGEISASGNGVSRPSYQYTPDEKSEN